jgi:RNA polymerase sigma-70 factor (ECF subfamily)
MNPDWNSFVKTESPRLFRYFLSRFDAATSDDLVQEVLIRLVRKIKADDFNSSKGSLPALSYGIAKNIAREQSRRSKRSREDAVGWDLESSELSSNMLSNDEIIAKRQEIGLLRSAISQLNVYEQEIISLVAMQDLSLTEIAELLDLPLNTVKSHIHRAKAKLREYIVLKNESGKDL